MIELRQADIQAIREHAARAYPHEACGLLLGRRDGERRRVSRIVPSANVAAEPDRRFEIDPALRFRLMRERRERAGGEGAADPAAEEIIGHYHSHPDGAAAPSATDLAMAYEPELVWLIVAVARGRAGEITAHLPDADRSRFTALAIGDLG